MLYGMTSDIAVLAEDLTKFYGTRRGIESLNLDVKTGEVMGFLGPNGAGKTTTIRLLLDFLRPTRGHATILGLDAHRDKAVLHARSATCPANSPSPDGKQPRSCCGFRRRPRRRRVEHDHDSG